MGRQGHAAARNRGLPAPQLTTAGDCRMRTPRRTFLKWSAAASVGAGASALTPDDAYSQGATDRPGNQTAGAPATVPRGDPRAAPDDCRHRPITLDERRARIDKARRLMAENRGWARSSSKAVEHVLLHGRALGPQRAAVRRWSSPPRANSPGSRPASRRNARAS